MDSAKRLWSFWFFIVALCALGICIAIYAYRLKFGGGLSSEASDWSAFGSYSGGVFGPLILFLTLLAVLKTVYLQRELLDNQVAEFIKLDAHQQWAAKKQDLQLEMAKSELELTKAQAYLSTQLQFIETLRDHYRREADGLSEAIKLILDNGGYNNKRQELAEPILANKQEAEQKMSELVGLSLELSMLDFSTVTEIRKACSVKLLKIMYGDEYLKAKGLIA
jgi:hypothetical protein